MDEERLFMLQELTAARLCTSMPHSREIPALRQTALDRARWFVFEHFELVLVLLLVSSMLAMHWFIDEKIAFLNFYYLPVIAADRKSTRLNSSHLVISYA